MNKFSFPALVCATFLMACANDGKPKDSLAADSAAMSIPAPALTDTLVNTLTVSENEMKDDSVFADGSIPTSRENAGITDVRGLKLFLKQSQQWVMNNDKAKLAAAVRYPLQGIKTAEEMIEAYDTIFTREVKLAFARINFNQVFRNQNGVMLGGGKVWITQAGREFKIFAIN